MRIGSFKQLRLGRKIIRKPVVIPAGSAEYLALIGHAAVLALYDVPTLTTMGQGRSDISTPATPGSPVGYVKNMKTGATGYHLNTNDDLRRPLATNGLTFDNSNDWLEFFAGSSPMPASATLIFLIKNINVTSAPFTTDGSAIGAIAQQSVSVDAGGSPAGTITVDTVVRATRDDFYVAACNGAFHTIEHQNANYSTFTGVRFNGYPGLPIDGVIVPVAILDTAAVGYATALANARTFAAQVKTRLGL